jgi:hypothetical protein
MLAEMEKAYFYSASIRTTCGVSPSTEDERPGCTVISLFRTVCENGGVKNLRET